MKVMSPPQLRIASNPKSFLAIGAAAILALLSATPADDSKEADKAKEEGDLVRVWIIDEGDAVVRRRLAHKTRSPDGRLFAGYYRDGWDEVISIHDAKTGEQIKRIVGHGDDVREFKFTPDGKILASRCMNRGRVGWALWDVADGKLIMRLPAPVPAEE